MSFTIFTHTNETASRGQAGLICARYQKTVTLTILREYLKYKIDS